MNKTLIYLPFFCLVCIPVFVSVGNPADLIQTFMIDNERYLKPGAEQEIRYFMETNNLEINKPHDNHSAAFASTASSLMQKNQKKRYGEIMDGLDKLSLPDGLSIRVKECQNNGLGDESQLYIGKKKRFYSSEIWDYIYVEDSIDGAWQAFLLYKIRHVLPLFWHANYTRRTYLYSDGDEKYIRNYRNEKHQDEIKKAVKTYAVELDVVETNGKYYVSCCFWSDFGGLIQEVVEISISPEHKASFRDINQKNLYEYNCGIVF